MINTTEVDIDVSKLADKAIEFNFKRLNVDVEVRKYYLSEMYEFRIGKKFAKTNYAFAEYLDGTLKSYVDSIPKSYRKDAQKFLEFIIFYTEK